MNASTAASRVAEIERYIAGVSAALADLPEPVRQELIEDLPDHLAEIAADDPASLDDRLGSPAAYAAELRAATGVDTGGHGRHPGRVVGAIAALRPHVRTFDEQVGRLIGYERLVDFLVQLRPAWWLLRGYVAALILLYMFAGGHGVLPHRGSAGLLGWLLVLVLVGLSIRIGRRPVRMSCRVKPMWLAGGAVALLVAGYGLLWIDRYDGSHPTYYPPSSYEEPSEVYVYTESGRSITNVRVYTRNGEAVPIGVPMGCGPDGWAHHERRGCVPEAGFGETPEPSGTTSWSGGVTPSPSGS